MESLQIPWNFLTIPWNFSWFDYSMEFSKNSMEFSISSKIPWSFQFLQKFHGILFFDILIPY